MLKFVFFNTDSERFEILKCCHEQMLRQEDGCLCFTEEQILKVEKNYDIFEKIKNFNDFINKEKEKQQKEFVDLYEKSRLYFIHYYQVLYMAIERGELPETIADYYKLPFPFSIPNPKTPEQLIAMSEHLFECDGIRIANGGKYFANPNIGSVKVWIEKFIEKYREKTNKYNVKKAEIENIENIRKETDELIFDIFEILSNTTSYLEDFEDQANRLRKFGLIVKRFEEEEVLSVELQPDVLELCPDKMPTKRKKEKHCDQLQFDLFFNENNI